MCVSQQLGPGTRQCPLTQTRVQRDLGAASESGHHSSPASNSQQWGGLQHHGEHMNTNTDQPKQTNMVIKLTRTLKHACSLEGL